MEITAKIIAHSVTQQGKQIVTFELEYPRFIHSELMTHRLFSRNAASSRAIPVAKMIEQVRLSPAMPVHWGKNQPGMQAKEELDQMTKDAVIYEWLEAKDSVVDNAKAMMEMGTHKQIVNRILEPFQMMKTVLTATEFDNFFWLRKHPDAQPEIKELAEKMWEALENSNPITLSPGDWHVPYYQDGGWIRMMEETSLEDALAISSSCCAQVSYRKLDDSLEKAKDIFDKLIESKPCHASPTEHQATPITTPTWDRSEDEEGSCWEEGVTHSDRQGNLWSGNLKGWIQHRQLIPENVCWNFVEEEV